jgi:MFS family permease
MQVLGAWVVLAATWGLINAFGVYQTYYQTDMLSTSSASTISWIGSLQACLLFLLGLLSGPLVDGGHSKAAIAAGLFLIVLGMFTTSISKTYWQVLLAQGICTGAGMGLAFLPATAILAQYFLKRRAFAVGIAGTGSPVGGIIFPIIFSKLLPRLGFGWATRVIAFILLALSVVPVVFMKPRLPPPARVRAVVDNTAWRDLPFMAFALGSSLVFLVLYTAFFYIQLFDELKHLSDRDFAPYTVTLLNAGSVVGRLAPMYVGDKFGVLNMVLACTFASAILAFGWMGIDSLGGVAAFPILYGITSGAVVVGAPVVIMKMSPDMARMGIRLGMAFVFLSVSVLVGPPIAGAVLGDFSSTRWLATIGYSAGGLVLGASVMMVTWSSVYRKHGTWKI